MENINLNTHVVDEEVSEEVVSNEEELYPGLGDSTNGNDSTDDEDLDDEDLDDEDLDDEDLDDENGGNLEELDTQEVDGNVETVSRQDIRSIIEGDGDLDYNDEVYDSQGNPIIKQIDGEMSIRIIPISDLILPPTIVTPIESDVDDLIELISNWGLVCPLQVIPIGNNTKYIVFHGKRRLQAMKRLGMLEAPCIVDSTRPKEIVRFLEVLSNNNRPYNFSEISRFIEFVQQHQNQFTFDAIDKVFRFKQRESMKAVYIRLSGNLEIIGSILAGKMTINGAFKKLLKDEDKQLTPLDELNMNGLPTGYTDAGNDVHTQSTDDREILPEWLSKKVQVRDKFTCQCCGAGHNSPELVGIFEHHHIVPVAQKGGDEEDNLVYLCLICHKLVHNFVSGKFAIPKGKEEEYRNIAILGNIIKVGPEPQITPFNTYVKHYESFWETTG